MKPVRNSLSKQKIIFIDEFWPKISSSRIKLSSTVTKLNYYHTSPLSIINNIKSLEVRGIYEIR